MAGDVRGEMRCAAHRTNGEPCGNYPMRGSNVCRKHGGATKAARERAQIRILTAADPAAAKLLQLMTSKKVPPQVQLAAARDLLDRAGMAMPKQVEVEVRKFEKLLKDGELIIDADSEEE